MSQLPSTVRCSSDHVQPVKVMVQQQGHDPSLAFQFLQTLLIMFEGRHNLEAALPEIEPHFLC